MEIQFPSGRKIFRMFVETDELAKVLPEIPEEEREIMELLLGIGNHDVPVDAYEVARMRNVGIRAVYNMKRNAIQIIVRTLLQTRTELHQKVLDAYIESQF